jgi:tetratricopeptide (TPR) repeat protein
MRSRLNTSAHRPLGLAIVGATVFVSASAIAKPAAQAPQSKISRATLIKQGRLCYRLRDYRCAVDRFRRANALVPSTKLLFNLASAEDKLQHRAQALRLYRHYLRESKAPPRKIMRFIDKRLRSLRKQVGWLTLDISPSVAIEVRLDDRHWFSVSGAFPVDPGPHKLSVRARGYVAQDHRIEAVAEKRQRMAVKLSRTTLTINSSPQGATVRIDGVERGRTPLTLSELAPGAHALQLIKGRLGLAQRISIAPSSRAKVSLTLEPLRASLRVQSTPSGARVQLDGKAVGSTPLLLRDLPVGRRRLQLSRPGRLPTTRQVTLSPFSPMATVSVALHVGRRTTIVSRPAEATVQLDGKTVGKTPLTRALPLGTHRLSLRHPSYSPLRSSFTLPAGTTPYWVDEDLVVRRRNASRRLWSYLSLGLATVAGITAGVLYARGLSSGDEAHLAYTQATSDVDRERSAQEIESAERQLVVGHVVLGTGIVALGVATYLFLSSLERSSRRGPKPTEGSIRLGKRGATVVWRY